MKKKKKMFFLTRKIIYTISPISIIEILINKIIKILIILTVYLIIKKKRNINLKVFNICLI